MYLFCLGMARLGRTFFWYVMSNKLETFWYMMIADVLHTFLLGGFFYIYRQANQNKHKTFLGFDQKLAERND